ncbi:diguanylate cyclase domain-containing protein [Hoeflea sp.]|uniref:sensor domain-containing diguanylate cyclase n=1 Tax=Hoeflea sp. TaxID=1940281 RepID=UPI003A93D7EB
MRRHSESSTGDQPHRSTLDRLLRFDRYTEERYEAEHGMERVAQLRDAVNFGILLYILHGISKIILYPDSYLIVLPVLLFVIVPFAVYFHKYVSVLDYKTREMLVFGGVVLATILPIYMVYDSQYAYISYMNIDVLICIIFGNVLIALRFKHAFFYTLVSLVFSVVAIVTSSVIEPNLKTAFSFQFTTVAILCLYSNYLFERRRCLDYCVSLEAVLRAEAAETSEKQFQVLSKTDALTGLPNRRFLDEQLDEWVVDSRSAVVMMIDIDHFKLFNDTLGHPAGDECLRVIADAFSEAFSQPDLFCARFGGEEFTLAVRDAEEMQARRLASSVVTAIQALQIPHPGRNDGMDIVTISVGVALKPKNVTTTREAVLSQADEALYLAKRRGRNCFVINDEACESQIQVNS